MMTIYLDFPHTYTEIMSIVKKFAYKGYLDVSDTVDYYLEQLIRLEVMRRRHDIAYPILRDIFGDMVRRHPILDPNEEYFNSRAIETYLQHSTRLWELVEQELTMLPSSDFLLWHVEFGIWKMYTAGVTHVG
ncbi:hypothetical protein ASESINO_29 [Erwinia phage vB_EamM_Asesino]|uniref:Uncharacterized protein n=1 Tax=Erwinia phage vB_EamM_Asesino TaxID=1883370 RepID=A0A1B2I9W6_9CAUD|nr:hypothetical protein ASESINO_29 [Erwinia phage vB_EamM_Asesino]ANZ48042.1 hypothetical protein ASESINO_29 [Erwinia phage vB_EamM_Asesino]